MYEDKELLLEESNNKSSMLLKVGVVLFSLLATFIITVSIIMYKDYVSSDEVIIHDDGSRSIVMDDGSVLHVSKDGKGTLLYEKGYYEEARDFVLTGYNLIMEVHEPVKFSKVTSEQRPEVISVYNELSILADSYVNTPKTQNDEVFEKTVYDIQYDFEQISYYGSKFVLTKETVYLTLYNEAITNLRLHIGILTDLEKKYYKNQSTN